MKEDRLPHLLFYGPPGTGKTSTILACARQLYGKKEFDSMVLEVRGRREGGVLYCTYCIVDYVVIYLACVGVIVCSLCS